MVQKPLCLNRIDRSDLPVWIAGANMGEDVSHAMGGEKSRQFPDLLFVSEQRLVPAVALKPQIITKPAVLHPDSIRPEVMPAVTNTLTGGPEKTGKAHDAKKGDEQQNRAPWRALRMLPYFHFFWANIYYPSVIFRRVVRGGGFCNFGIFAVIPLRGLHCYPSISCLILEPSPICFQTLHIRCVRQEKIVGGCPAQKFPAEPDGNLFGNRTVPGLKYLIHLPLLTLPLDSDGHP